MVIFLSPFRGKPLPRYTGVTEKVQPKPPAGRSRTAVPAYDGCHKPLGRGARNADNGYHSQAAGLVRSMGTLADRLTCLVATVSESTAYRGWQFKQAALSGDAAVTFA
jgi:hypothetical protein